MSKAISSYPKVMRSDVVAKRLDRPEFGLGFWAAVDAFLPTVHPAKRGLFKAEIHLAMQGKRRKGAPSLADRSWTKPPEVFA